MVTPSVIDFNYKKFDTLPPAVLINFSQNSQPLSFIIPDWVDVYDITTSSAKIKLNTNVNALVPASYSEPGTIKAFIDGFKYVVIGSFTINLLLQDTVLLSISPVTANFTFEIGGTAPANKIISVTSENTWGVTKTAAWLNLPITSGFGSGTFSIGVNTSGLAPGTYNDTVTVNDGGTPKTVAVSLVVSEGNTGVSFLYINPNLLNFGYSIGGLTPPEKNIELNASAAWTATTDQSWVILSVASGPAGASTVPIALQTLSGLVAGDYFANITFTVGSIIKTVVVKLTVTSFITELLSENVLYFTDDENVINVASGLVDTFLKLDFTTLYKSVSYFLSAEIPFFKGKATKRIGERPKVIIGQQSFLNYAETSLFQPYPVLSLNVVVSELVLFLKTTVQSLSMNNLKFIKGTTPTNNWISASAKKIYVTKNAIVYLSIITNGVVATKIEITGAQTKTYNFAAITAPFLTAVVHLNDIGYLKEGDALTIDLLGNKIEVVIKAETSEQSICYFENEWGVWDAIEFTGAVTIKDSFSRQLTTVRKTELYTETKIIDVTKPVTISINTGEVHTDANVQTISKMLQAKNIYLQTNNTIFKVNPTTNDLPTYETDRQLRDFDLTFKNVIE